MKEIRSVDSEFRIIPESRKIEGLAISFNTLSQDLGGFREIILPESVNGVIEVSDILATYQHDEDMILARSTNGKGTLSLDVDEKGLHYSFDAPKTTLGDTLLESIKRGDIRNSSFAFTIAQGGDVWEKRDGSVIRTIKKFDRLWDVAAVARPAYQDATVALRSMEEAFRDEENREMKIKIEIEIEQGENLEEDLEEPVEPTEVPAEMSMEIPKDEEENSFKPDDMEDEEDDENKKEKNSLEHSSPELRSEPIDTIKDDTDLNELKLKNNKRKMNTNFSLLKTIRDIVEGRSMSEETLEVLNAGRQAFGKAGLSHRGQIVIPHEYRDQIIVTQATLGQEIVAEEKQSLLGALYAKSVLGTAGATFYNGLVGDVSIPVYAGTSSAWATETGSTADGGGAFSEITLSPKRLTTYIDISKQFIAQDGIDAEATLMADLTASILNKVENTVFDGTAGSNARPAGLFYGADYSGSLSGVTTWAKLVGMKGAVEANNALLGNPVYITTPSLAAVWETTTTDTGSGIFCMQNGRVAGYPVLVTSNVLAGKAVFGNFQDYVVGSWGGLDITVDPYTQAVNGKVRIIVNSFWDFKPRRSVSFKLNQMS